MQQLRSSTPKFGAHSAGRAHPGTALALINYSLWDGFPVEPDRKQLMPESCHFRCYSPYPHPQPAPERTGDYDGSSIHSRWLHLGGFFSLFRCLKVRHRVWRDGPVVKSIRHSSSGGLVFYSCTHSGDSRLPVSPTPGNPRLSSVGIHTYMAHTHSDT